MAVAQDKTLSGWYEHASTPKWDGTSPFTERSGVMPTYTPLMLETWSEGTNGNTISTSNFVPRGSTSTATYTNAVTGPFGAPITGQFTIEEAGRNFGGSLAGGVGGTTCAEGTSMWIRVANRIPAEFCAGYQLSTGEGSDGYGSTKWIRLGFAPTGQRLTLQLSGFLDSACGTNVSVGYISDEIGGSGPQYFPSSPVLARNTWNMIQIRIYFSTNASLGYAELWIDDTYIGQTGNFQTLPVGDDVLNDLTLGDYWNGASQADNTWQWDEIIVTQETPNTLDSGGRPYISELTQVSDFS